MQNDSSRASTLKFCIIISVPPCILTILFQIYSSFRPDDDILLAFPEVALLFLWPIIACGFGIYALVIRQPARLMPLILSVLFVWGAPAFFHQIFPLGDYLRLAASYSEYNKVVEKSPNKRHRFKWGSSGWSFTTSFDKTLVYDPTDKLPEENKRQNVLWENQFNPYGTNAYPTVWYVTKPLFGHFYVVEEWNQ
jgi:hypothetical protein